MASQITSFPEMTSVERNALTSVPVNTLILNTDTHQFEVWDGSEWNPQVGAGQSGAFAAFASSPINTRSTVLTSTGFLTFDNSPAFTIIPSVTGTYKVYCPATIYSSTAASVTTVRIFNTSGGATLLQESQGVAYNQTAGIVDTGFCQSTYNLTAGTTYVFDIQGEVNPSGNSYLDGSTGVMYMFAEGISLQGTLNTTGSSYDIFASSQVTTDSTSFVTSVYPSFTTFDNSPAFTFKPAITGKYKVYASVPIFSPLPNENAQIRMFNLSGGATLLQESQSSAGAANVTSNNTETSLYAQSIYQLTAGVTYVFNIQGAVSSGGSVKITGTAASFYMFAEGIGLNNNAQQFPVTFKAVESANSTNYGAAGNIYCDTVLFDSNSSYNHTTGVYTCPYDGYYSVGLMAQNASGNFFSYLEINGTTPNGSPQPAYLNDWPTGDQISSDSTIIHMKKGDLLTWVQGASAVTNFVTVWVNSVSLDQGLTGPNGSSTGSAFAYFASAQVTTRSSSVATSPGFSTADNSPAFTFTPTISGIYKVYSNCGLLSDSAGGAPACRIFNTSGGGTLLQESQGIAYSSAGSVEGSGFCQSVYSLTAGTTYVFDIQLGGPSNVTAQLDGELASFYMFAEGIGLTGAFSDSTSPWDTNLSVTPNGAFGSFSGLVTQSRVVGDTMEFNVFLTAGASLPTSIMALALPTGYVIDASKLSANGAALDGWANSQYSGSPILINTAEYLTYPFFDGSDTANIYFASQTGSNAFTKAVSNGYLEASTPWQAIFKVPIVGLFGAGKTGVSRIVRSNTTGDGSTNTFSTSLQPILDLSSNPLTVTVNCDGGDVEVGMINDNSGNTGSFGVDQSPTDSGITVNIYRDAGLIYSELNYMQNNVTIEIHQEPVNQFRFIDTPTPGSHTYTVQVVLSNAPRTQNTVSYSQLYARPLA